ncbi:MAG: tRNA uridine-5-carboxymethylaminomethyl(34) synthesis GTPase MnmE [Sandarakinorhabdus sp.]|nr:tRNA uridine-5-carboxymethylaminomethyl(34) synthesis GTPase MnmE [Sandarakinorhabdus sp.]
MVETVFALSSGALPAGVAVVRLSGPDSLDIVRRLSGGACLPPPRTAMLRSIIAEGSDQLIDKALVITFPAPNSFTGENVAEIHCHGGIAVVAALQQALMRAGARPAEPGEFTRRAFESGRIDLTQAEALGDLIEAETDAQREQALSQAGGRLRDLADEWRERLVELMAGMEADLDFADEGDVVTEAEATPGKGPPGAGIGVLAEAVRTALATAPVAERIRQGLTIAIVGPPNVGKSSLLNALARRDVAIVTPHAGTTRDVLEVHLNLGGRSAVLLDTAGIRETDDPVEAEGISRARARAATADLVLDLGDGENANIVNRIDEIGVTPGWRGGRLYLSARTGEGLAELEAWLSAWAAGQIPSGEPPVVTTARQSHLLQETLACLVEAERECDPVLVAESLRSAAHALGRLTGRIDPETVLGAIFSRFCIGK